jgi:hypothetical protein
MLLLLVRPISRAALLLLPLLLLLDKRLLNMTALSKLLLRQPTRACKAGHARKAACKSYTAQDSHEQEHASLGSDCTFSMLHFRNNVINVTVL